MDAPKIKMSIEIDWEVINKCTHEEKQAQIKFIEGLLHLMHEGRSAGVLVYIKELEKTKDAFMNIGYKMLISGQSPDYITLVLGNLLYSSKRMAKEYLNKLIFMHYILLMQCNITRESVQCILLSYLGIDYAYHIMDRMFNNYTELI